jgi:hypothetical protein
MIPSSGKAPNRRRLIVEDFKNRVKLCDLKQILNALGKIQQLHNAALICNRRESGDHFTDSRAVDIAHFAKV